MAQFSSNEVNDYSKQGGGAGFFSLKNDKDTATGRFLYETKEDIKGYSLHEIMVNDKKRYVNCLREAKDPIDRCPLCQDKYGIISKVFIPWYSEETGEVKIWDRGASSYIPRMESLCDRYSPLVGTIFDIERNGKKGDTKTDYTFYPTGSDDSILENFPEVPNLLGTLILDKSFDELVFFLENGFFNEEEKEEEEEVTPRNTNVRNNVTSSRISTDNTRRTPANTQQTRPNNTQNRRPENRF